MSLSITDLAVSLTVMNSQRNGIKKSKLYLYNIQYSLGVDMVPIKVKRNPPQKVIHPIPPQESIEKELKEEYLSVDYYYEYFIYRVLH